MNTISLTIRSSEVNKEFDEGMKTHQKRMEMDNRMSEKVIEKVFNGQLAQINNIERISNNPWQKDTQINVKDHKHARYRCYQYALVDPNDMKRLHNSMNHPISSAHEETVADMVEEIENGNELPIPSIAFKPSTNNYGKYLHSKSVNQVTYNLIKEGRHRTAAALRADIDKMPVVVTARRVKR